MGDMGAGSGMLIVETIAKVRRAYFVQKKPIKAICREFRLSRKVVRKVIRSQATEFHYERGTQPLPKIGPWRGELDSLLLANERKTPRERLTLVRMFEELRGLGYAGSYDAVRRYAKVWRKERGTATAQAYVPLTFAPGEAYQFDWSHEIVLINGVTVTVKVAHVRLCHSRMLFVRAYTNGPHDRPIFVQSRMPIEVMTLGLSASLRQASPGCIDDVGVGFEDAVGEPVRSQVLPDVLDRVQFGRLRRQERSTSCFSAR